jgi:hypothetical protein
MSDKKNEGRRHKRYIIDGIQGNVLYPADLEILNISIDGAAIETTKWLDLNREYTLKVKYKDIVLNLRGRIVWAVLTSKEKKGSGEVIPVYRAGVRFTDTLSEKTTMLINFIEENKIRALEKRLVGVRFKIVTLQDTKIDYPYKYEVKKMSLSGMLVETEYALDLNSNYDIELFLADNVLNIIGRIAYCEKIDSDDGIKYNIGIEFAEVSDNDKGLLKEFLNTLEDG